MSSNLKPRSDSLSSHSSSSSSSSSEDEFLTNTRSDGNTITEEEREAIIRKKLLENFYGKSHVELTEAKENELQAKKASKSNNPDSTIVPSKVTDVVLISDLDSSEFDAYAHTVKHLRASNVTQLLSVDEKLALDIRTLNSTMQTLVYENYSKFIDATDAVRSIAVDSSEDGLQRLTSGMERIEQLSKKLDQKLTLPRDAVAEKIRVKRHLSKLDSLLKLPETLNKLISEGKYRLATKTHASASMVLSKHSAGFESLARIEMVCRDVMVQLYHDLFDKIIHWSHSEDYDIDALPSEPKSVVDILECGGTLCALSQSTYFTVTPIMTVEQCQTKTLNACANYLGGLLTGQLPTHVLDGVLEACTLFSVSFHDLHKRSMLLGDFVAEVFAAFLAHVRTSLLELTLMQENATDMFVQISSALSALLRSVREMASGLALPEVGVDMRVASSLVDQTVEVTESAIRKYVSLRFEALKLTCVKECLKPFLEEITVVKGGAVEIVRLATVVLEDMMQVTEQSIEAMSTAMISSVPVESAMLELVVVRNARRYGSWLADVLEILAGSHVLKSHIVYVDVKDDIEENGDEEPETHENFNSSILDDEMSQVSFSDSAEELDSSIQELVKSIEQLSSSSIAPYLTLAIAELCRLAQHSVVVTMNRSILKPFEAHHTRSAAAHVDVDKDAFISKRLQLAACRVLALYAMDQGANAARFASCHDLSSAISSDIKQVPTQPRVSICKMLQIIKSTSLDFSHVFGGERKAGPIPTFLEDDEILIQSRQRQHYSLTNLGAKGLKMEVDRLFAQKIKIYSNKIEFRRDSVLYSVFVIVLKAFMENVRFSSLSLASYRQVRVDMELMRFIIPHYIKDGDYTEKLFNMVEDVLSNANERCNFQGDRNRFIGQDEFVTEEDVNYYATMDPDREVHHSGIIVKNYLQTQRKLFLTFVITDEEG